MIIQILKNLYGKPYEEVKKEIKKVDHSKFVVTTGEMKLNFNHNRITVIIDKYGRVKEILKEWSPFYR